MNHDRASTMGSTYRRLGRAVRFVALALGLALTGVVSAGRAAADSGRGTANASIPFMLVETFQGQPPPAPGGRCPVLTLSAQGTGLSSTFGQYTIAVSFCSDPNGPNPLAFTNGIFTLTNANGDTLFGSGSGILRPSPTSSTDNIYLLYGEFTIEGGTGAFAGASGGGMWTGVYNIAAGDAGVSGDGVIALPDTAKP